MLVPTNSAANFTSDTRQQPDGPYQSTDPRWKERLRLLKEDPRFEWKTPIAFYGKVIDQNAQPIPGFEVEVGWTDMSPKGTSAAIVTTDAEGNFSITGIRGKNLGVRSLKKDGPYRSP
jgi:protocatechuate 3,4-dioxygenase beta subunit